MCWYFYFSTSNPFWYRHLTCLMLMTFAHFLSSCWYISDKSHEYIAGRIQGIYPRHPYPTPRKKIISIFSFKKIMFLILIVWNKELMDVIKAKVCFVEVYIYLKILTGLVIRTPYLLPPHRHLTIYKYIYIFFILLGRPRG